jgi:putative MATE family efflux protein
VTTTGRLRRIAGIAVPIVGGMVSQNVLTLVDTAMVGSLGEEALAAVSTGSFANFVVVALMMGLSSGVQAMAARRHGEGDDHGSAFALNSGLVFAIGVGLPLGAVFWALAPWLYPLIHDDPAVVADAVPYLKARLCVVAAVGVNFAFRGYWNAVDKSHLYMSTLVAMHAANIVLSYGLIFGIGGLPELGALGAGVGTAAATALGSLMYVVLGLRHARDAGFLGHVPSLDELAALARLTLPASIQQVMFAFGITTLFAIIGTLGTSEVAAAGVLINVSMVAFLPGLALGMASASLVGQALGHGDRDDAYRWGWEVSAVAVVLLGLLGLPMVFTPDWLLAPFLHEAEPLSHARPALRLVGALLALEAVGLVLMQSLLGAGAARTVMKVSVGLQWGFFLPGAYLVGPVLGGTLLHIWIVQAIQRSVQSFVFIALWMRRRWADIAV